MQGGGAVENDSSEIYDLTITLNVDGKDISQSAQGTQEELSKKVFTFGDLQVGTTVFARCDIKKDGVVIWSGKSETKTISAGTNNVTIKMSRNGEDVTVILEGYFVNGGDADSSWGAGNDENDGKSMAAPFKTLQQALDVIIAEYDAESKYVINVKGTIYPKEYTEENGVQLDEAVYKMANFNALGTTPLNLSIVGVGTDATLSGKTSGEDTTATTYGSVVVIGDYNANAPANSTKIENLNLSIENLTIRDGYVPGGNGGPGGGIFNNGATVTLKDCNITKNGAWKGSGIYSMNGTIITDNTTIKENIHDDNSTGIQLDNSILKVKNTLTLYKNVIVIDGNSTITSDDGSGATIKCGATPEEIQNDNPCGYGIYVSASAGSSVEDSTYATLSLSGSLAFEGFSTSTGVHLDAFEEDEIDIHLYGRLTLDGKITGLSVELEANNLYGLISLGGNYSTQSTISVKSSYSIESDKVFINGCDSEDKAKTFIEVTDSDGKSYTVIADGKVQTGN